MSQTSVRLVGTLVCMIFWGIVAGIGYLHSVHILKGSFYEILFLVLELAFGGLSATCFWMVLTCGPILPGTYSVVKTVQKLTDEGKLEWTGWHTHFARNGCDELTAVYNGLQYQLTSDGYPCYTRNLRIGPEHGDYNVTVKYPLQPKLLYWLTAKQIELAAKRNFNAKWKHKSKRLVDAID